MILHFTEIGLLFLATTISFMALSLGAYITYRLCKIEAKLDRVCEVCGCEIGAEEELAYRHQPA